MSYKNLDWIETESENCIAVAEKKDGIYCGAVIWNLDDGFLGEDSFFAAITEIEAYDEDEAIDSFEELDDDLVKKELGTYDDYDRAVDAIYDFLDIY